jgi:SAM-dependent methyltransferase
MSTLRELTSRLTGSMNALSVVGAVLAARARGDEPPPTIRRHMDDVLAALGVDQDIAALGPGEIRALLAEIRLGLRHAARRLAPGGHTGSWTDPDPQHLQDAGDVSFGFTALLRRQLARLDGLDLEQPTRFLEVGVGVAAIAIEMARAWPALSILGIDRWAPSLALARANVESAGLAERIALREQAMEDLAEPSSFDLAWVPAGFVPPAALEAGLPRVRAALRTSGWLLLASPGVSAEPLAAALVRLRGAEWGGSTLDNDEAGACLAAAGFTQVTPLLPPGGPLTLVAGRA